MITIFLIWLIALLASHDYEDYSNNLGGYLWTQKSIAFRS